MADAYSVRGADRLQQRLAELARRVPAARGGMLYHAGEAIRAFMVDSYLSGQRLRRISGRLAGRFSTVLRGDDEAVVGSQLVYAGPHEFGFQGVVSVRPFMRARTRGGAKTIAVRGHARQMNVRPKYYARDAARFGAPTATKAAEAVFQRIAREVSGGNA